ncbi:phosphatidylinositol 4,5-bisphosphate 3-kinase catalytic subunit delta isoform [Bactrocera dorsalis]|uniref:phosphatidylinositol 3-kinase n=2 Tax=Bactrocera dorsalis TaxID=27457 RepID=A0A6I9VPN6_BACDO|nr:phosphatidylinositol 4,5-bisphosphate 3-kinase catalytic subunit delta isoform [Bactrocera dorsalis]XP_011213578.1 phosphatidylinositol 4,5-bisphosphate 3-kinase catalytic subunit delta isoform [Bactrocera dorsalis]XP_049304310.1 phosphatidylinositol 4,5-bisphosphate 3-kinase catalytic subunit delta isoform [Bactrocera dorsalis]XP_049304311.1 phosphatidylinositol 4,5-bisphosphate 3-kinase catalytic subunit delta isoform [Bactrocera dorsalis]
MAPLSCPTDSIDFWRNEMPERAEVSCLMPNGILILTVVPINCTIREIKTEVIREAKNFPLCHLIKDPCDYEVSGISNFANVDCFTDETKRLSEIQPFFCLLRLGERTEPSTISSDYELSKLVSNMIGKSFEEYSAQRTPEVDDFRRKLTHLCDKMEQVRSRFTWSEKLLYEHPMRVANTPAMPELIRKRLGGTSFLIVVKLENDEGSYTIPVSEHDTSSTVIESALMKMQRSQIRVGDRPSDYILKVRGRDEFIFGEYPIIQFIYIQESLSGSDVPNVVLKPIHTLQSYINYRNDLNFSHKRTRRPEYNTPSLLNDPCQDRKAISSWDILSPFKLRIYQIENVNCDLSRAIKVGVHIGLFHGERRLCATQSIEIAISNNRSFTFEKDISFDIQVQNLPRMARLCMVVYEVTKASRSKKSSNTNRDNIYKEANTYVNNNPLAWVNTTIFDYKHQMLSGCLSLYTWTYADDIQSEEIFHPLGTIEPNPRKDGCAIVKLSFQCSSYESIQFPSMLAVLKYAEELHHREVLSSDKLHENSKPISAMLSQYLRIDKVYEMHDQDRNALWSRRYEILAEAPEELSTLLHCVNWNERDEVAETWNLLQQWPTISVERSLELLDYAYPDPAVRSFAIRCLRFLRDEELLLYLLQLVQAMKHESYLDCDLVTFLLERALRNQRIGHYFFWHLRSEMQTLSMQTRFGLLLEGYLKGCKPHVPHLCKQLKVLDALKAGSLIAKKGSKEKGRKEMQDFLSSPSNSSIFQSIQNPLNPSFRCKGIQPEKCKVMDSKMRPLWIVLKNADQSCNDIYIIFKNGDDLRQDMLTLQMLRVMDQLWKNEGMDFRMNIYNCISMERRLGMIEVVLNAETIANIQKEKGMFSATSPFKKGSLFSWLKEYNRTEEEMNKAINEFTLSCAGYCVATYVLGVADRHSDNIMVKRNGQLFHIDFGHILGHFKEKFGVRRERVPFVLTHDFVYVISKGRNDRDSEEFLYFQNMCEKAFLVLRKHGCLILSLFSMMISTGLPELSSEKDLNYLKETLVLDYTEEKAREHFRSKFSEALVNSWKTSLNWASHNFSKNNKQ